MFPPTGGITCLLSLIAFHPDNHTFHCEPSVRRNMNALYTYHSLTPEYRESLRWKAKQTDICLLLLAAFQRVCVWMPFRRLEYVYVSSERCILYVTFVLCMLVLCFQLILQMHISEKCACLQMSLQLYTCKCLLAVVYTGVSVVVCGFFSGAQCPVRSTIPNCSVVHLARVYVHKHFFGTITTTKYVRRHFCWR